MVVVWGNLDGVFIDGGCVFVWDMLMGYIYFISFCMLVSLLVIVVVVVIVGEIRCVCVFGLWWLVKLWLLVEV